MSAGIYAIVHLKTGRKYIGSSMRIEKRWGEHRRDLNRGAHRNRHLQFAWRKYGPSAFAYRVIEVTKGDVEALLLREQWHIDRLGSDGYNLATKAGSTFGIKPPPASEALRAQRSEAARVRIRSDDECAKIRAALTGRKNGPPSEATKRKISAKITGTRHSAETINKLKAKAKGRKLPERTPEIDAKIKIALRAAWIRRKERERMEA